ncbi:MAG: hypothetical protein JWN73_386 [Betaproteobacteria bacterium]|nr:hypothetical protein [Betaproteobacteria bacterium]
MTRYFISPEGSDGNSGLGWQQPVRSRARLAALIDGDNNVPHQVCFAGNFDRDWAPPGSIEFFRFDQTRAAGIRLSATAVVTGQDVPLPVFCDYDRYTNPARAVRVGASNVWEIAGAVPTNANRVRRLWGCDYKSPAIGAQALKLYELWESGCAGLDYAQCHAHLGARPDYNWTQYNAAGALGTSLYIACPENPISFYGGITVLTDLSYALMVLAQDGWTVDPELTFRGGGYGTVILRSCSDARFEAALHGWHFYTAALMISDNGHNITSRNLTLAPDIDCAVNALPFFCDDANPGHNMAGHHGILITADADLDGLLIAGQASNGRQTRIADCMHAGIGNYIPLSGRMHRNLRVERNAAFDFGNVIYGRAFGFVGPDTQVQSLELGGIVTRQPTCSQASGRDIRFAGLTFSACKPDAGLLTLRFGGTRNTTDTASAISLYTTNFGGSAIDLDNVSVTDCTFDGCLTCGLQISQFDPAVPFKGSVNISGCTFIAPTNPAAHRLASRVAGSTYAVAHNMATPQPEQQIRYANNTAIGYTMGRRFVGGPPHVNGVFRLDSEDFMPAGRNVGWTLRE